MKIAYKNKVMNLNLVLGLVWLALFFAGFLFNDGQNWVDYGWLAVSAIYLILYFYQRQNEYLTMKKGVLKVNGPFGKKIDLNEVKSIKKFAGEYTLYTDKKKLKIYTQSIASDSLAKLDTELHKLDVKWN